VDVGITTSSEAKFICELNFSCKQGFQKTAAKSTNKTQVLEVHRVAMSLAQTDCHTVLVLHSIFMTCKMCLVLMTGCPLLTKKSSIYTLVTELGWPKLIHIP
jgi:hypothetical protein